MLSHAKKKKKVVAVGVFTITARFNNLLVNVSDRHGGTIVQTSAGARGFKGSKKCTPYAAQVTAEYAANFVYGCGMKTVFIVVKGPGLGRDSAIRAVRNAGLGVIEIVDKTPVPHNGCRLKKRRRV